VPTKERFKQQPIYRDHVNNPIQVGDLIMFTSIKQCRGLTMGRVLSFTPKRIRVMNLTLRKQVTVATKHCVVITQQINYNMSEPVEGFYDSIIKTTDPNQAGQSIELYLERRGFKKGEDGKYKHKHEDEIQRLVKQATGQ
jgi:hypothetical protein